MQDRSSITHLINVVVVIVVGHNYHLNRNNLWLSNTDTNNKFTNFYGRVTFVIRMHLLVALHCQDAEGLKLKFKVYKET